MLALSGKMNPPEGAVDRAVGELVVAVSRGVAADVVAAATGRVRYLGNKTLESPVEE